MLGLGNVNIGEAALLKQDLLVSVVIPMFNSEKWIRQTLISVCEQDYTNLEIIVIDDGSSDGSSEIVKQIIAENSQLTIKLHSIENSGVSFARNLGISLSSGKLIALLDSDDLWDKTKLSQQVRFLNSHPEMIAILCDFFISIPEIDKENLRNIRLISKRNVKDVGMDWLSFQGNGGLLSSTILFWGEKILGRATFDSELSTTADLSFFLQLLKIGKVGHLDIPLVQYRQHENQMHSDPDLLRTEYPLLLDRLHSFSIQTKKRKLFGNLYVMCGLLNLPRRKYRRALLDFLRGFILNPVSIVNIPLSLVRKRIVGSLLIATRKSR